METNKERERDNECKRKREEGRESIENINPFAKSKRIGHSPKKETEQVIGVKEMEEIKVWMREMKEEIIREIKEDNRKVMKEMEDMREEMREKERAWQEEKNTLTRRIEEMEKREEEREKKERKNNMIITGIEWTEEDAAKKVEEWMKKELEVEVKVEEAFKVGERKVMLVKMGRWEEKRKIMMNKWKLKGRRGEQIYIDDDLTKKERMIQKKIREEAKMKMNEGKRVKVGYKKIVMDGRSYKWNERTESIEWNVNF